MTAVVPPLTPVQQRVMRELRAFIAEYGYAPSLREIGARCERSTSTIDYQVRQLEQKGWVRRHPNRPRSLVVLVPDGVT